MITGTHKEYDCIKMNTLITKKEFAVAESKMFDLLSLATQKGGFDNLSAKEKLSLNKYTSIVKAYEDANFTIPVLHSEAKEHAALMNAMQKGRNTALLNKTKKTSFLKRLKHAK